jgi:hypothetical protein
MIETPEQGVPGAHTGKSTVRELSIITNSLFLCEITFLTLLLSSAHTVARYTADDDSVSVRHRVAKNLLSSASRRPSILRGSRCYFLGVEKPKFSVSSSVAYVARISAGPEFALHDGEGSQ